jgi:pectate lyase-like protein
MGALGPTGVAAGGQAGAAGPTASPGGGGPFGATSLDEAAGFGVDVRQLGALGDGVADDSAAFQAAFDAAHAQGGGVVFVPAGTYLVANLRLYGRTQIVGEGVASLLRAKPSTGNLLSVNPGDAGSADPANNERAIVIRDLALRGTADTEGFAEHVHLLNLNGVSDVSIERVHVSAFRGDGLFLGSSNVAGVERHNERVTVRDCVFDGVNRQNRNGISVIDGTAISIVGNDFRNVTKPDMPGAIDIEPDNQPFHVVRDVQIENNRFRNVGGNLGVISLFVPYPQGTRPVQSIRIVGNVYEGAEPADPPPVGLTLAQRQDATDATAPNDIFVQGNVFRRTQRPFQIAGVKGVRLEGNVFDGSRLAPFVSFNQDLDKCQDIEFSRNTFRELSTVDGVGVAVFRVDRIAFVGNTFDNLGMATPPAGISAFGYALDFLGGGASSVRIEQNLFLGPRTHVAVMSEGGTPSKPELNRILHNVFSGLNITTPTVWLPANTQVGANSVTHAAAAPTSGAWKRGDLVYNLDPMPGGSVGWVCTASGSPGTWKAFGAIEL